MDEQHSVEELNVVIAAHESIVVADPFTLQPTVEVVAVAQDHHGPQEAQETAVIVAVAALHLSEDLVTSDFGVTE